MQELIEMLTVCRRRAGWATLLPKITHFRQT
jgi:hypothetical protein